MFFLTEPTIIFHEFILIIHNSHNLPDLSHCTRTQPTHVVRLRTESRTQETCVKFIRPNLTEYKLRLSASRFKILLVSRGTLLVYLKTEEVKCSPGGVKIRMQVKEGLCFPQFCVLVASDMVVWLFSFIKRVGI